MVIFFAFVFLQRIDLSVAGQEGGTKREQDLKKLKKKYFNYFILYVHGGWTGNVGMQILKLKKKRQKKTWGSLMFFCLFVFWKCCGWCCQMCERHFSLVSETSVVIRQRKARSVGWCRRLWRWLKWCAVVKKAAASQHCDDCRAFGAVGSFLSFCFVSFLPFFGGWGWWRVMKVTYVWVSFCLPTWEPLILTSVLVLEHILQNVQKTVWKNWTQVVGVFFLFALKIKFEKKKEKYEREDSSSCEASRLCRCFTPFK